MEFKFNVSEIFPSAIVEVNQSLIPPGFSGDRRGLSNVVAKVADVINTMGDASACAQGLSNPITTAERLRKADQTVYLLVDRSAKNGKGVVTGMLKTGKKSLYIFDRDGQHYHVAPPCVLDFYVHESRQRQGLGKQLFEHMLNNEQVDPSKLAIDRPSEKLLSFMNKHYGLQNAMRQMNNYVVFDGFFPESQNVDFNREGNSPSYTKEPANGLQSFTSYGRYGAPRPPCSMGEIIHNQSPLQSSEPTGDMKPISQTANVAQSNPVTPSGQNLYSNQMQNVPMAYQQPQQQQNLIPPQQQQQQLPFYQQPLQQTYTAPMYQTQQQNPFNQLPPPPLYNAPNLGTTMSVPNLYVNNNPPPQYPQQPTQNNFQTQPQYIPQYPVPAPPQNNFPSQVLQPSQVMQVASQPMIPQQMMPTPPPTAFAQNPHVAQHASLPIITNQPQTVQTAQTATSIPSQIIRQQQKPPSAPVADEIRDGYPSQRPPNPLFTQPEQETSYKYYDSTKQTMQTHNTPNPAPGVNTSGHIQHQMPQEGYQQTANMNQPMPVHQAMISTPTGDYHSQPNVNPSQDQSGQMFGQSMPHQSQLVSSDTRFAFEEPISQSPKLERPRSLIIQRSDESENLENQIISNFESEVHFDEIPKDVENNIDIEPLAAKSVAVLESAAPEIESDANDASRKSPNSLTAQGFFDLKFYHSRLW